MWWPVLPVPCQVTEALLEVGRQCLLQESALSNGRPDSVASAAGLTARRVGTSPAAGSAEQVELGNVLTTSLHAWTAGTARVLNPGIYGIAAGAKESARCELGDVGTLRLSGGGVRQVMVVNLQAVCQYLGTEKMRTVAQVAKTFVGDQLFGRGVTFASISDAHGWLRTATGDDFKSFLAESEHKKEPKVVESCRQSRGLKLLKFWDSFNILFLSGSELISSTLKHFERVPRIWPLHRRFSDGDVPCNGRRGGQLSEPVMHCGCLQGMLCANPSSPLQTTLATGSALCRRLSMKPEEAWRSSQTHGVCLETPRPSMLMRSPRQS